MQSRLKTFILCTLALIAFAANSVLCRLALKDGAIDAASFTLIRLMAGIVILLLFLFIDQQNTQKETLSKGNWLGSISLFLYAAFFSFAYVKLDTATGALILFGTVQISLITYGWFTGNVLRRVQWLGFILACFGFAYLLWPELTSPSFDALLMMGVAGLSWAVYTANGKASHNPLADTAYNFLKTAPLSLVLAIALAFGLFGEVKLSTQGVVLAFVSGAFTSGLGYAIWYAALKHISGTTAAVSQLTVPVIAALMGVVFAAENLSLHLTISAFLVLGGVFLVVSPSIKAS